ncbi:MAG: hypothetical protein FWC43_02565 [Planctomycetaceae bacterium]|nr:hypothetical protein [Planctomycetaceae bacterium]MCL2304210.1 hypothetical protein [Planctomycetaceae bacterium]
MPTIIQKTYQDTPDYIVLTPPGKVLAEKIHEMGIDADELAERCELPQEIVQRLLDADVVVTREIAEKLEKATWIPVKNWIRYEENYRNRLELVKQYPEKAVY